MSRFDAAQALKNEAEIHLDTATSLCETLGEKVPNLKHMMTEIEVVECNFQDGAFFSFVTTEERRAVLAAVKGRSRMRTLSD